MFQSRLFARAALPVVPSVGDRDRAPRFVDVCAENTGDVGVILGALAAGAYGINWALQHHAAATAPEGSGEHPLRLIRHLIRRRVWLIGLLALIAGSVLQSIALAFGGLTVVEPLLIASLPAALAVGAVIYSERVTIKQWLAAAGVCVGLTVFIIVGSPRTSQRAGSNLGWLGAGAIVSASLIVLCVVAWSSLGSRRALALATASSIAWGLSDALTKAAFNVARKDSLALLMTWRTYAVVGVAAVALTQSQMAFHAAPLRVSLPSLAVGEPIVGLFLGVAVLSARLRHSPWALLVEATCGALMIVAAIPLARAPVVSGR